MTHHELWVWAIRAVCVPLVWLASTQGASS
jgi:hypothetical protein